MWTGFVESLQIDGRSRENMGVGFLRVVNRGVFVGLPIMPMLFPHLSAVRSFPLNFDCSFVLIDELSRSLLG